MQKHKGLESEMIDDRPDNIHLRNPKRSPVQDSWALCNPVAQEHAFDQNLRYGLEVITIEGYFFDHLTAICPEEACVGPYPPIYEKTIDQGGATAENEPIR
jgi:hypothetical protein